MITRLPAVVVLCTVLVVGACSSDDHSSAAPTTMTSTTTTTTVVVPPRLDDAKTIFTQLVHDSCEAGSVPDPAGATIRPDGTQYRVTDVAGDDVLLDLGARAVTSLEGPGGILPSSYSFGCDPKVFQGTLDH